LGATFPEVTAVVAELPSGLLWPGADSLGNLTAGFAYQGKPLPYINAMGVETKVTEPDGVVAYSDRGAFVSSIAAATPAQIDAATIRVEKSTGPILMFGGASDELWPACDLAKFAIDRLAASGHDVQHGDKLICYPDAGHNVASFLVGVPTASAMHTMTPVEGHILALGGTPKGIAHAARDADTQVRAFFAANL
jgi:dienelactone hydrolase